MKKNEVPKWDISKFFSFIFLAKSSDTSLVDEKRHGAMSSLLSQVCLSSCIHVSGGEPGGPWGGHLAGEGEFLPRGRDHFSLHRGKGCPLQQESPSESVCFQKELVFLWAVTVYSGCDKSSSLSCLGSCGFSKVIFRVKRESVDRST